MPTSSEVQTFLNERLGTAALPFVETNALGKLGDKEICKEEEKWRLSGIRNLHCEG